MTNGGEDELEIPARISRLSFWNIALSTVGISTASSLRLLFQPRAADAVFSTPRLLAVFGTEALIAAFCLGFLRRKAWSLNAVTRAFEYPDLLRAVGLLLVASLAYVVAWYGAWAIAPAVVSSAAAVAGHLGGRPAWWAVALVSLTNPFFEEFLYLAFLARVLEAESPALAVSASTVARVLAHTYQGPFAHPRSRPQGPPRTAVTRSPTARLLRGLVSAALELERRNLRSCSGPPSSWLEA
jgi:Type II CAAX prenyl endopeptidase Rce1-like